MPVRVIRDESSHAAKQVEGKHLLSVHKLRRRDVSCQTAEDRCRSSKEDGPWQPCRDASTAVVAKHKLASPASESASASTR
jgi:hypothetical protein